MLDNTSSSSLRSMEIGLAPGRKIPRGHDLPPPPAAAVAAYETKPLPPIPTRRSGISSFSTEIQDAFRTPTKSGFNYHMPEAKQDLRETSIATILETDSNTTKQGAKVDSGYAFTEGPVQEIRPLLPAGSLQKLLQITGAGSTSSLALTNTSTTPSGHNPAHKLRQIMGLEIPLDETNRPHGPAQEVSPLTLESDSSSIYSQYQEDTVSEPEIDSYGREQLSSPGTSVTLRSSSEPQTFLRCPSVAASAVPASLHIVKEKDRNTFGRPLTTVDEPASPTTNNYSHANGAYRQDLYHATVAEIAQSTSSSFTDSQPGGNSDYRESTNFSYPGTYIGQSAPRQSSFSNRTYQSKVRIAPPLGKLDTLSATRYNAPVKTPYPLPPSRFEFDDDDQTPTQRDYDSGISPNMSTPRPSRISHTLRRVSSPLSPSDQSTPAFELTPRPFAHPPVTASPLRLQPPAPLKQRVVKSHDNLRSVASMASSNTSAGYTPPTSITTPYHSQSYAASTNSVATTFPHSRRGPPPVPSRGPPLPFTRSASPEYSSKPSLAGAAAKNFVAWAGRTAERLEQARQAAGIQTRSERRRARLKSKITVMSSGRLEDAPGASGSGFGKRSDGAAVPRTWKTNTAPSGAGFQKYSDEKAWAATRNMI